jgi:L-arabinonolactonase
VRVLSPELKHVVNRGDHVGETPIWSNARNGLYWVNCEAPPQLQFWDAASGDCKVWPVPQRLGGFVLERGGGAFLALADGLYDLDLDNGALSKRVACNLTHASLHECRCDRNGRVWVGSIDRRVGPDNLQPAGGTFFRLQGDRLIPVMSGISCSNGLAFSPDGKTLYHTDSPTRTVFSWTVDPLSGDLSNKREFARLEANDGFCDGATVDAEGGYWMALVFGGKIRRYLPDGTPDIEIPLPFASPSNVAFGGPDYATLYITTTKLSIGAPLRGEQMLGGLYSVECGYRGLPEPLFSANAGNLLKEAADGCD